MKYKHPTCKEQKYDDDFNAVEGEVCGGNIVMHYDESSEYMVSMDNDFDPDLVEDSYGIKDVYFRCSECNYPIVLTETQLKDFIKWGDENLSSRLWRTWDRYIKPFLVHQYQTEEKE